MSLTDSNAKDFSRRLQRIEKQHRNGYGFEAPGTLGRTQHRRREWSLLAALRVALLVLAFGWVLKGGIYFLLGTQAYQTRIDQLSLGPQFDPALATVLQVDPVTQLIAAFLGEVFPHR